MVQERPESTDSGTLLQAEGLVTDETADQEEEIQEGTDPSILFADSNELDEPKMILLHFLVTPGSDQGKLNLEFEHF